MKRFLLLATCLCITATSLLAQDSLALYRAKKDNSGFDITADGADYLASLPLKCILQQFPNKTSHTSNEATDHVLLPKDLHPSFYGCFDWHSSVHGHWMLVKLLKLFPDMAKADSIRLVLNTTITPAAIQKEVDYFNMPLASSWERTYGWAWFLKLDEELYTWPTGEAQQWRKTLQPLTQKIVQLWKNFLPKQTYPNRTGVHPNTAFGLVFALDYARTEKDTAFENAIITAARKTFTNDSDAPALWEPNGSDFLSPSLEEASLMKRVLSPAAFAPWFSRFLPYKSLEHLTNLPVVSDRTDLQIVHLDGLCFSRSWCMKELAATLPGSDKRKQLLKKSSFHHLQTALPHIVTGNYGGEHWLASFAVYALTN